MQVSVSYMGKKRKIALKSGATVGDAMKKSGVNAEMVLVKRGKEIIPDAEKLKDGDKLVLLRVVTGG